jgi:FkbM family methyltransferase
MLTSRKLKEILRRTRLYRVYQRQRVLGRETDSFANWTEADEQRLGFYREFIGPGDLVFDVGANLGTRSKVFLELGAEVVAFEPQRLCADFLIQVLGTHPRFKLLRKALGARPEIGEMHISDTHYISSLSRDWIEATSRTGRFQGHNWATKQRVEIDTLDNAIAMHGCPRFIKIDVEGYEAEVLSGLSQPIQCISIEFTPERIENTYRCIERLCTMGETEFQISLHESSKFELPTWSSSGVVKEILAQIDPPAYGDLYVRRITANQTKGNHAALMVYH